MKETPRHIGESINELSALNREILEMEESIREEDLNLEKVRRVHGARIDVNTDDSTIVDQFKFEDLLEEHLVKQRIKLNQLLDKKEQLERAMFRKK